MAKTYGNFNDLITFTRASSGTALRPISYGDELVVNGDFSYDGDWAKGTGWTISGGVASGAATYSYLSQAGILTVGKIYSVTYTVSYTSGIIALNSTMSATATNRTASGTYTEVFVSLGTEFSFRGTNFTGSIDNISVREVLFDQPNGTLTLFNHPTNIPRIEYDADGNRLGLLVEESRTNLVKYSEPDSRSTSNTVGEWRFDELDPATEITNVSGPDGQTDSARECVLQSTIFDAYVFQVPVTSGNKYTVSAYVKLGTASNFALTLNNGVTWNSVTDGAKTFTTSDGLNTETFTRISLTFTAPSTNKVNVHIGGHGGSNPAQDAGTVILYGFQVEAGEFPTSLIPTSGSTATRSADVASIGVSEFGYNQKSGAVVVEAQTYDISQGNRIYEFHDGSSVSSIRSQAMSTTHLVIVKNSSLSANLDAGTFVDNTYSKLSAGFNSNSAAVCIDSGSVVSGNLNGLPTITDLNIGSRYDGSFQLNGHIKSIKYYPRRLTNAQLQELTS